MTSDLSAQQAVRGGTILAEMLGFVLGMLERGEEPTREQVEHGWTAVETWERVRALALQPDE